MHALRLHCRDGEREDWVAELWSRGTIGVTEREQPNGSYCLEAFFEAPFETPWGEWVQVEDTDWGEEWKRGWEPIEVGRRWFLVPDWRDDPTPDGRLRLVVHARQASGSGYQPATQLALAAMEEHVRQGDRVFDWGVGSGILSSAAVALGAGLVMGCDIDPAAVEEARANLDGKPVRLMVGSGRSIRSGALDVVVGNLNAATLLECLAEMARIAGRTVVVSGFRQRREGDIEAALVNLGWSIVDRYADRDWRCLVARREQLHHRD
jgi:ribosomal protein L11 methyltransferase